MAESTIELEVMRVVIGGLRELESEMLQGIKVGSLLEVAVFTRVEWRNDEGESDEAGSEDGHGGSNEGSEDHREEEGDLSGVAAKEDETAGTPDTTVSNESTKKEQDPGGDEGGATAVVLADAAALHAQDGNASTHANLSNGPSSRSRGDGSPTDVQIAREGDVPEVMAAADPSSSDSNAGQDGPSEDNKGSAEDDEEIRPESDEEDDEDDEVLTQQVSRELYIVLNMTTEDNGDDITITDVQIRELTYQNRGEEADFNTYRIFGNIIELNDKSNTLIEDEEPESLVEMVTLQPANTFTFVLNPGGDRIRNTIFGYACPARCARGWLPDQTTLQDLLDDELEVLQPYRPLCPVCLGKDLTNEQILLRGLLESMGVVDIGMVVEYLGRLNPRRRVLGYHFVQFDEREWGYGFDDMLDEDGSERDDEDGDVGRYEHWEEAMDPNANPKTRPASKDTVAALPRKRFAQVAKKEDGAFCAICQEGVFEEESKVVALPCGHIYDEGCLEAWIMEYDNCPECRATVSGMVEVKSESAAEQGLKEEEDGESSTSFATAQATLMLAESKGRAGVPEPGRELEMDGEDTIMSDVDDDRAVADAGW